MSRRMFSLLSPMTKYQLPITLFLLTACAQPTTYAPNVTPQELAAEQRAQHEAALVNPFPPVVEPVKPTPKMQKRLQKIANRIAPEASRLCRDMHGTNLDKKCNFALELSGSRGVNAHADGEKVVITGPMMVFAGDDTHLAFVLAHEIAHNMMEHHRGLRSNVAMGAVLGGVIDALAASQGYDTGGTGIEAGAEAGALSYSPSFEREADYVGLYILARAGGYDIRKAPDFWRAMSQFDPSGIYVGKTHPTNPERYVAMQKTIKEIAFKQQHHIPLLPERKAIASR